MLCPLLMEVKMFLFMACLKADTKILSAAAEGIVDLSLAKPAYFNLLLCKR